MLCLVYGKDFQKAFEGAIWGQHNFKNAKSIEMYNKRYIEYSKAWSLRQVPITTIDVSTRRKLYKLHFGIKNTSNQ